MTRTALTVRAASEADLPQIDRLDVTYTAGERVLSLRRSGGARELTFRFRWRAGTPVQQVYGDYTQEKVRGAFAKTDLFLVAEHDGAVCGLLMVIVPAWTDAGEITDLVVDRRFRRRGVGRALVEAAVRWARERNLRALWVEPRTDNVDAIEFYLSLGFRLSGFNDRLYSNRDDEEGRATIYMYLELH